MSNEGNWNIWKYNQRYLDHLGNKGAHRKVKATLILKTTTITTTYHRRNKKQCKCQGRRNSSPPIWGGMRHPKCEVSTLWFVQAHSSQPVKPPSLPAESGWMQDVIFFAWVVLPLPLTLRTAHVLDKVLSLTQASPVSWNFLPGHSFPTIFSRHSGFSMFKVQKMGFSSRDDWLLLFCRERLTL